MYKYQNLNYNNKLDSFHLEFHLSVKIEFLYSLYIDYTREIPSRIIELTADIFVRSIGAILLPVAEEAPLDARTVAASEEAVLAERLLGVQKRLRLPLLVLQLAVVHRVLPVAGLLVDVEVQSSRAPDRLQPGTRALDHVPAIVTLPCNQSEPFARILVLADLALEALLLFILLPLHAIRAL